MKKSALVCLLALLSLLIASRSAGANEGPPYEPDAQLIAKRIEELTNEARARKGLGPAVHVDYLERAATDHSREMIELGYFSHSSPSPDSATPKKRIILAGGWDTETGENIYRCSGGSADAIAQRAMDAWLASPGHYRNIMNPNYNSMGVGVVVRGNSYSITQDFSKQAIAVVSSSASAGSRGVDLELRGKVRVGSRRGAVFVNGAHQGSFEADANGNFVARLTAPAGSVVSLGQEKAARSYTITLLLPPLQPASAGR